MINISYLITVHNEDKTLHNLLVNISSLVDPNDEIIILDDFSDNPKTLKILSEFVNNATIIKHALNKNYGEHKNYGIKQCKNEWIFQIDSDENPSKDLIQIIKPIIEENPEIDLYYVPRINDFKGVTEQHAKQWGWKLSPCPDYNNRPIVNWPDYQSRVFLNKPDKIRWDRRLHEKIEGHKKFGRIPAEYDFALYHDKTIEKQLETNKRYNQWFTQEENRGHSVFSK